MVYVIREINLGSPDLVNHIFGLYHKDFDATHRWQWAQKSYILRKRSIRGPPITDANIVKETHQMRFRNWNRYKLQRFSTITQIQTDYLGNGALMVSQKKKTKAF